MISQNRQFQFFAEPTYIYPCVPAYAATLLKNAGNEVFWDDGIAEEKSYDQWLKDFEEESIDLAMIETKTPVVKKHWKIIDNIKEISPETKVALVGDHVTALPEESILKSKVDFILTGGDYDFLLLNLVNWLKGNEELEPGIWFRNEDGIKNTGRFQLDHDLNTLPFIDRDLTRWDLYSEKNGNFKKVPGMYTMIGRDCWWHRCTFCSWTTLYPKYRMRRPELLIEEIGLLVEKYGVKTIFDDSGSFPVGEWLKKFCELMIESGYNKEIEFGCNMRFGACSSDDYKLMKMAGFRMVLFGLESASQATLDKIDKNMSVGQIKKSCKEAKDANLEPHLTIMLGYPWEDREDAFKTFELAKFLFQKGYADTLQATMVIPYPGTPLFEECKEKGLLMTEDWDEYDMRSLVMRTTLNEGDVKEITQNMYRLFFNPSYVLRKVAKIRSFDDMQFILRGTRKVFGHIRDFSYGGVE
ncbi:MAG: radical SAM protein [Halobacteriota archaeon]|nr:radical SAM protein [Halobacteriota archaeon]